MLGEKAVVSKRGFRNVAYGLDLVVVCRLNRQCSIGDGNRPRPFSYYTFVLDAISMPTPSPLRQLSRPVFEGVTPGRRRNMQANVGKHTKPEMTIRKILHKLGYRYRLHAKELPGKPDIVFTARRKLIEHRGCYWHGHGCFPLGQLPKTRIEYWSPKIAGNKARDAKNMALLRGDGWDVLELWECRVRAAPDEIADELVAFLGPIRFTEKAT